MPPDKQHGVSSTMPTENNKVHDNVRKQEAAWKQLDAFLKPDGKIESFCDGACDPR